MININLATSKAHEVSEDFHGRKKPGRRDKKNCYSFDRLLSGGTDTACVHSIFIKTSQFFFDESCLIPALTKFFGGKLRMLKVASRGR